MPADRGYHQATLVLRWKDGIQQLTEYTPPRRKAQAVPQTTVWPVRDKVCSGAETASKRRCRGSLSRGAKTTSVGNSDGNRNDYRIYTGDRDGGNKVSERPANNIPKNIDNSIESQSSPTTPSTHPLFNKLLGNTNVVNTGFENQARASLSTISGRGCQTRGTPFSINQLTHPVDGNSVPEADNAPRSVAHAESDQGQNLASSQHAEAFSPDVCSTGAQPAVIVGQAQYSTTSMVQRMHHAKLAVVLQCSHCGCYSLLDSQQDVLAPYLAQGLGNQFRPAESLSSAGHHDPEPLHQSSQFDGPLFQDHSRASIPDISAVPPSGLSDLPAEATRNEFPQGYLPQSHSVLPPLMIPDTLENSQIPLDFSTSTSTKSGSELFSAPQNAIPYGFTSPYYIPNQGHGLFPMN